MIWFSEAGDIVFEKNEDLGWFAAGLIWLLSVSIILFLKKKKNVFCCKRLPTGFWMEMLSLESVTLLYSAGLVCSLPYPILPRSDRSLQWFWIPFFLLSKFQTGGVWLCFFFLFLLPVCLVSMSLCCASALAEYEPSSLFSGSKRKGEDGSVLGVQAASLLLFVPQSSRKGTFLQYFRGSEWCLALPCVYEVLFQPSSLKSSSLSTLTSLPSSTGACFCSRWRPGLLRLLYDDCL